VITVGSRLGPYEILAPVGAGGMGEVWRARDQRLQRDVAIKVIPDVMAQMPDALARFEREARSVAALSHPNILAIHDFGNDDGVVYAVMELLEGVSLRDRLGQSNLAVSRALEWAHQIAQGLAAAHERGIVHRDVKPENIFITRDGLVKILDFGLARLEAGDSQAPPDETTMVLKTRPGLIVGTIGYLSPEQARGEEADPRSDIFAFGTVFYEMLAGRPAFVRPTQADTLVAILREEPKALAECAKAVPAEIEDILAHCLEKNRDDRFRSARDLAFALRLAIRTGSAPAVEAGSRVTPRPSDSAARSGAISIAVLPFRNISPTAETEYFSDGMTEEIINSISNIPTLQVAARTSSFAFKGRDDDIRKIGRELGVEMVVEGSVRQAGSRLRVSAQLINVDSGYQVWSERWDREVADVFAVQDEIAQAIASTFKVRLVQAEGAGAAGKTQNVEAYDRYLKGRFLLAGRRAGEAIVEFQSAIENDPDFVDAHNALADGWAIRGYYGGVPTWEAWARGAAAVDEAERIAPDAAGIPLSRAILEHYYGWNTAREESFCRLAIERNPKSAEGWNWLGLCLAVLGRMKEALEATGRGIELEPYHDNVRTSSAWAWIYAGDYETAERVTSKAIELSPNALYARWTRGIALRSLGRFSEAISIFEQLVETSNRMPFYVALLGGALAAAGERSKAEVILADLQARRERNDFVASLDLATVLSALGDADAALDALEQAREERNALLWARIYFPDHIWLRDRPRFRVLARRLGRTAPVILPARLR
jgi:serine/threonine protein kinase/Flp pilus assembly protein TadD